MNTVSTSTVDDHYYQVAGPDSLGERLMVLARDRIYRDFLRLCRPDAASRILDVGVSDVVGQGANVLERCYPHPDRVTAAGLGEGTAFQASFPAIRYVRITANAPLPFADGAFDIATSNAVIEHVGSVAHQRRFIQELARVARTVFITMPNRYFPVEHHTAIPLLHYSDRGFALACRLFRKQEWADPENLILMSRARLRPLLDGLHIPRIGHTGLRLGVFSSNLFVWSSAPSHAPNQKADQNRRI